MAQSLFLYFIGVGALLILMRFIMVIVFGSVLGLFSKMENEISKSMKK